MFDDDILKTNTTPKELISINDKVAVKVLLAGGIIACPTEGVWGLSCRATEDKAIKKLLKIKGRSSKKGLIVLTSSFNQVKHWVGKISKSDKKQLVTQRQYPTTWIVPSSYHCPSIICGKMNSLAIRIVTMSKLVHFCEKAGPIISTSANYSGRNPCRFRFQVLSKFKKEVDWICTGNTLGFKGPSRIETLIGKKVIRGSSN